MGWYIPCHLMVRKMAEVVHLSGRNQYYSNQFKHQVIQDYIRSNESYKALEDNRGKQKMKHSESGISG